MVFGKVWCTYWSGDCLTFVEKVFGSGEATNADEKDADSNGANATAENLILSLFIKALVYFHFQRRKWVSEFVMGIVTSL